MDNVDTPKTGDEKLEDLYPKLASFMAAEDLPCDDAMLRRMWNEVLGYAKNRPEFNGSEEQMNMISDYFNGISKNWAKGERERACMSLRLRMIPIDAKPDEKEILDIYRKLESALRHFDAGFAYSAYIAAETTIDLNNPRRKKLIALSQDVRKTIWALKEWVNLEDWHTGDGRYIHEWNPRRVEALCKAALNDLNVYGQGIVELMRQTNIAISHKEKFADENIRSLMIKKFDKTCEKLIKKLCRKRLFDAAKKIAFMLSDKQASDAANSKITAAEESAAKNGNVDAPFETDGQINRYRAIAAIAVLTVLTIAGVSMDNWRSKHKTVATTQFSKMPKSTADNLWADAIGRSEVGNFSEKNNVEWWLGQMGKDFDDITPNALLNGNIIILQNISMKIEADKDGNFVTKGVDFGRCCFKNIKFERVSSAQRHDYLIWNAFLEPETGADIPVELLVPKGQLSNVTKEGQYSVFAIAVKR